MCASDESICKKFLNKKLAFCIKFWQESAEEQPVTGCKNFMYWATSNQEQNQNQRWLGRLRAFSRTWHWLHVSTSSSDWFTALLRDWINFSSTCVQARNWKLALMILKECLKKLIRLFKDVRTQDSIDTLLYWPTASWRLFGRQEVIIRSRTTTSEV